ncbi:MAG: UDP-N-acetylmuramate dehydrogenase [Candidatus Vogelbacteria bacterium]|nr:UDP-N-acetylmuramate dehydrogenase [Candidatus Vogelbacteria bacterium]
MSLSLCRNVPLAPLTTFAVGGRARWFVSVSSPEQLVEAVKTARVKKLAYRVFAGGSNVVFGDRTFHGLMIQFRPKVKPCHWQGLTLTCQANLPLASLIKTAVSHGLAGLENLSGIPGTVGGAIVGNAGAYGQGIADCLTRVEIFDGRKTRWLDKKQCSFVYRESIFKRRDWLVLRAEFRLTKGDKKVLAKKSREIIKIRSEKYNPRLRSPGSFFKNVLVKDVSRATLAKLDQTKIRDGKIPAGYLLEAVGAKGMRQGGIRVADFHGNLLINDNHGTYRDVITLAAKLKKLVQAKFGIQLDEEVRYLGV